MRTYPISLSILGLAALSLLALDGCGGGNGTPPGPVRSETRSFQSLQFQVEIDKAAYTPGETMQMTFRVTNTGPNTVNLKTRGARLYHFQVIKNIETPEGLRFPPGSPLGTPGVDLSFAPGETKTFHETWDLKFVQEKYVPGGSYSVKAYLSARLLNGTQEIAPERDLTSATIRMEIKAPCRQDPLYAAPGEVLVGVREADLTPAMRSYIEKIGTEKGRIGSGERLSLHLQLKSDVCIQDAIPYLKANPKVRYAERNGIGSAGGGG
jgi:hypothetical protein